MHYDIYSLLFHLTVYPEKIPFFQSLGSSTWTRALPFTLQGHNFFVMDKGNHTAKKSKTGEIGTIFFCWSTKCLNFMSAHFTF